MDDQRKKQEGDIVVAPYFKRKNDCQRSKTFAILNRLFGFQAHSCGLMYWRTFIVPPPLLVFSFQSLRQP